MNNLLLKRELGANPESIRETLLEYQYSSLELSKTVRVPKRHNGPVNDLDVDSTDATLLASAGGDSSIRIWALDGYKELRSESIEEENDSNDFNFFNLIEKQDDLTVTTGYQESRYPIPQVAQIAPCSGHSHGVSCVKWWPFDKGMIVSSSYDHTIKVWDTSIISSAPVSKVEPALSFNMNTIVYSHSISKVGLHSIIAIACDHPNIRLLDIRTGSSTHTLRGHNGKVVSVAWHPTRGYILASGGSDGAIRLWDIRSSASCLGIADLNTSVNTISNKKNQSLLNSVNNKNYNNSIKINSSHTGTVNSLLWHDSGFYLISAGTDEQIRVWDMTRDVEPINLHINYGPSIRNAYSQTIKMYISPSNSTPSEPPLINNSLSITNQEISSSEQQLQGTQVLYVPTDSGPVLQFDLFSGSLLGKLSRKNQSKRSTAVTSRNNDIVQILSANQDGRISIWEPINPEQVNDFDSDFDNLSEGNVLSENEDITIKKKSKSTILDQINSELELQSHLQEGFN